VGGAADAKALVVTEVQVQLVEFEIAELPDPGGEPGGAVVATPDVDHQAAFHVRRRVPPAASRDGRARPHELQQRASAIERAGPGVCGDRERSADAQPVPLVCERAIAVSSQHDVAGASRGAATRGDADRPMEHLREILGQRPAFASQERPVRVTDDDSRVGPQSKRRALGRRPARQRRQRRRAVVGTSRSCSEDRDPDRHGRRAAEEPERAHAWP
jgi:hypothetical protein